MARRTHNHGDGPVEQVLREIHTILRSRVRAMTVEHRSRLRRSLDVYETHFFAWLRGNDRSISFAALDDISAHFKTKFAVAQVG